MKKLTYLLMLTLLIFSACKKDKTKSNADLLIGRWSVEKVVYRDYENGVEVDNDEYLNPPLNWEFRGDGTATVSFEGGDEPVKWVVDNNMLRLTRENSYQLDFKINTITRNKLEVIVETINSVSEGVMIRQTVEFALKR
ncbi:lipocalin-like domain-containing protein [Pedobacter ureilyticus]|uniref:Lipocalin family protein n=1 Tax=Pedobacter ureilyticus TaxID=1393051 RepID=A0ABW9J0D6_9SPHI|nr:lipocalin family protein [Pedobacter helvus]